MKLKEKVEPKYEYEVAVFVKETKKWFTDMKMGEEFVVIRGTLANKEVYDSMSLNVTPKRIIFSVRYYMRNNMLFRDGALYGGDGVLILKEKVSCSKEDWEEIKKGNIEKFLN